VAYSSGFKSFFLTILFVAGLVVGGCAQSGSEIEVTASSTVSIKRLVPGTSWQWQLSGNIDTNIQVEMFDLDLYEAPTETMRALQDKGVIVICYFSAGSWENFRTDAQRFPATLLGRTMDNWPDEKWLDIRDIDQLGKVMRARLDLAVAKGCDGVEPDNVDGYDNNTGFPLSYDDQIRYNKWLAREAHRRGLSIGLKNDLEQIKDLVNDFDWALNEECFQYNECEPLVTFVNQGKAVFGVEYNGNVSDFCPKANQMNFDWLLKNIELDAKRISCR